MLKSDQQVLFPRPRRFFRHQDQRNWIMSYIYIIYIIWDTGTRMEKCFDNRHFFFKSIELVKASFEILRNIVFTFWYQVSMFWLCYPQYTALCLQPCLSKHVVLESYQNLTIWVLILLSETFLSWHLPFLSISECTLDNITRPFSMRSPFSKRSLVLSFIFST